MLAAFLTILQNCGKPVESPTTSPISPSSSSAASRQTVGLKELTVGPVADRATGQRGAGQSPAASSLTSHVLTTLLCRLAPNVLQGWFKGCPRQQMEQRLSTQQLQLQEVLCLFLCENQRLNLFIHVEESRHSGTNRNRCEGHVSSLLRCSL